MADRTRPGDKITIHHRGIRAQVRRTRRQLEVLYRSGWREGSLPPAEPAAAKKTTSSASVTSGDGGK